MSEEIDEKPEDQRISFRISAEEFARVRKIMEFLAARAGPYEKLTQKRLFLEGLAAIEVKYSRQIKDRERRARQKATKEVK